MKSASSVVNESSQQSMNHELSTHPKIIGDFRKAKDIAEVVRIPRYRNDSSSWDIF